MKAYTNWCKRGDTVTAIEVSEKMAGRGFRVGGKYKVTGIEVDGPETCLELDGGYGAWYHWRFSPHELTVLEKEIASLCRIGYRESGTRNLL
jgi:hypothetical protein